MEDVIRALEKEIEATRSRLELLEDTLGRFQNIPKSLGIENPPISIVPGQFASKPLGSAIREYLALKRSPADFAEIQNALALGGSDLGRYPKRSVKLAIVNNPTYFEMREGHVSLRTL